MFKIIYEFCVVRTHGQTVAADTKKFGRRWTGRVVLREDNVSSLSSDEGLLADHVTHLKIDEKPFRIHHDCPVDNRTAVDSFQPQP